MSNISTASRLLPGLVTLALLAAPAAAQADTLAIRFGITMLGLALGTATLNGSLDGGTYRVEAGTKLTGLAAMMSSSKGSAVSTGALVKNYVAPSTYATTAASSEITRTVRMAIAGGAVKAVDISPPFEDKPGRVPLTDESRRGIIDPLSSVLMGVPDGQPLVGPTACNRTLAIFDGYVRFNVTLAYTGTRMVKARGYSGPVSVCAARYVPLAGHRPERSATKYMINNKQMEVWLAPVEKAHVVVPYRIAVQSQVGMLVIEAQDFVVEPGGQAKAQ